jgi:hypothetical protein
MAHGSFISTIKVNAKPPRTPSLERQEKTKGMGSSDCASFFRMGSSVLARSVVTRAFPPMPGAPYTERLRHGRVTRVTAVSKVITPSSSLGVLGVLAFKLNRVTKAQRRGRNGF